MRCLPALKLGLCTRKMSQFVADRVNLDSTHHKGNLPHYSCPKFNIIYSAGRSRGLWYTRVSVGEPVIYIEMKGIKRIIERCTYRLWVGYWKIRDADQSCGHGQIYLASLCLGYRSGKWRKWWLYDYFMGLLAAHMSSWVYEVLKGEMLIEWRLCFQCPKSHHLLILVLIPTMGFFLTVPCLIRSSPRTFAFPLQPQ